MPTLDRHDHRSGNDDETQPGNLFCLMSAAQKASLLDAIAGALKSVPKEIQDRQIALFTKADPAFGAGVAARLNIVSREAEKAVGR